MTWTNRFSCQIIRSPNRQSMFDMTWTNRFSSQIDKSPSRHSTLDMTSTNRFLGQIGVSPRWQLRFLGQTRRYFSQTLDLSKAKMMVLISIRLDHTCSLRISKRPKQL